MDYLPAFHDTKLSNAPSSSPEEHETRGWIVAGSEGSTVSGVKLGKAEGFLTFFWNDGILVTICRRGVVA